MFSLLAVSILAFYTTSIIARASLTPPTESLTSSTSSVLGSTTTTNGSLSVTPTSSAQFPSLSGFSDCVTNCLQLAVANATCTSVTDVNCYCKTARFTRFLVNCTEVSCTQDVGTAESLAQQFCFIGNPSTSLSFPPTTSIPSSSLTTLASSTPTNPSGTTSGSVTPTVAGNTVGTPNATSSSTSILSSQVLGLGLALFGVLVGAALVE